MNKKIENLLLSPQIPHVRRLLDSLLLDGVAVDTSPVGCGKMYCGSAISAALNIPVVIVCPKIVKTEWKKVLGMFGVTPDVIINYEKLIRGNTPYYKINKSLYLKRKGWWDESNGITVRFPKNCLIILDEAHKGRGAKSKTGEMMVMLKRCGYKVLMLSATIATNVPELKASGYLLNLHDGFHFTSFCADHGVTWNQYGSMEWDKDNVKCKEGILAIHDIIYKFTKNASKMNQADFGNIFPDNTVIAESFDLEENTDKLQAVYDDMQMELAKLDERSSTYSQHHFAIIMHARRMSELLKVNTMVDWIEERFEEGVSPVVFFNFSDSMNAVYDRLVKRNPEYKDLICKIVGGQSDKDRNLQIAEFQADKRRIALVNLQAGSVAVSLHDLHGNYPRHTLINPSWSAINLLQAIGRCHRCHGKTKVIQKFLFAQGVEERQRERVSIRTSNIYALNDGDLAIGINFY